MRTLTTRTVVLLLSVMQSAVAAQAATSTLNDEQQAKQGPVKVYPPPERGRRKFTIRLPGASSLPTNDGTGPAPPECSGVEVSRVKIEGGYIVILSRPTFEDEQWHEVATGLAFKYGAETIVYEGSVSAVRDELAGRFPRYACFVAQPEEANRQFVVDVHRVTRKLDDDPYTDVLWGILTGYGAGSAARIVACSQPLILRKGAGGTSIPLHVFDEGVWYDEGRRNHMVEKTRDGKVEDKQCPDDTTEALVDVLVNQKPDFFMTSGHATERDWQIGYSYRNGQFRCRDGILIGVDTHGKEYPIVSPNPKVYLPVGNCLMGHIKDRQCMALAFMNSAGVYQMCGYVVETWYGYGGWGILDYFLGQPGRFTLAESFHLNNQALVYQLERRFPDKARFEFNVWGGEAPGWIAEQLGYREWNDAVKDNVGLLWDRDTVAFYGDPAWPARMTTRSQAWEQRITEKRGVYTFELTANQDVDCGRPPVVLLPHRVQEVGILEAKEFEPVVTDNFLMLPKPGHLEKGKTYRVAFKATRVRTPRLSRAPDMERGSTNYPPAGPLAQSLATERRRDVAIALQKADNNRCEILTALRAVKPEHREAMAFLVANMPERDLTTLRREFLVENVELAYKAREEVPWGKEIPDEVFLNDVLPYANVNERRDNWRKDLHDRFIARAKECRTPGEAALRLNKEVLQALAVKYHPTKRPKSDQSPYESTEAGFASCTGLSVLLADACRAVAIPARLVGTPAWTNAKGNHTWVEVWDRQWRFIGAGEAGPLDQTWFVGHTSQANPHKAEHCIYAASFCKTTTPFPLVWDPTVRYVSAVDVTRFYTSRRKVTINLLTRTARKPTIARLVLRLKGQIVGQDMVEGAAEFWLAGGCTYETEVTSPGSSTVVRSRVALLDEDNQSITLQAVEAFSDGRPSRDCLGARRMSQVSPEQSCDPVPKVEGKPSPYILENALRFDLFPLLLRPHQDHPVVVSRDVGQQSAFFNLVYRQLTLVGKPLLKALTVHYFAVRGQAQFPPVELQPNGAVLLAKVRHNQQRLLIADVAADVHVLGQRLNRPLFIPVAAEANVRRANLEAVLHGVGADTLGAAVVGHIVKQEYRRGAAHHLWALLFLQFWVLPQFRVLLRLPVRDKAILAAHGKRRDVRQRDGVHEVVVHARGCVEELSVHRDVAEGQSIGRHPIRGVQPDHRLELVLKEQ